MIMSRDLQDKRFESSYCDPCTHLIIYKKFINRKVLGLNEKSQNEIVVVLRQRCGPGVHQASPNPSLVGPS